LYNIHVRLVIKCLSNAEISPLPQLSEEADEFQAGIWDELENMSAPVGVHVKSAFGSPANSLL